MNYALMWLEALACGWLLIALMLSVAARSRSWFLKVPCYFVMGFPFYFGVALTILAGVLKYGLYQEHAWFGYTLSWTVLLVAGAAALVWVGRKPGATGEARAAAGWPLVKLALGLVLSATLLGMTFASQDEAMKARMAALRGEAGALALSVAPPRVADGDNAALVYQQAFEPMQRAKMRGWCQKRNKWFQELIFDPSDADEQLFMQEQQGVLELLRKAAAMPDCYFEHDYGRPSLMMPLPELASLRDAARLLRLDADRLQMEGKLGAVAKDLSAIFGIARHLRREPTMIASLVAMMVEQMGVEGVERQLSAADWGSEDLASLALGKEESFVQELRLVLRGEEALVLSAYAQFIEPEGRELWGWLVGSAPG